MSESSQNSTKVPNESGDDAARGLAALRSSPEYIRVRRRARAFTFLTGALVIAWFLLLLWASGYQRDVLAIRLVGQLSLGMVFAWSQILTAVLAAVLFVRHSRRIDDEVSSLRDRSEGAES